MNALRRPVVKWLAALLCLGLAAGVQAAQRALLVGVSELVNQPSSLWLQAPRNDVLLMRQVLQRQGFAPGDVTVVADGVSGAALPEARQIHQALARLLEQSASGDFVLLYFSGHGTRLRDGSKRYQEPDGLAENFLARDVRGAFGTDSALEGGLRDVDVDAWVRAFLARNVFVWAVFDTCSATSMTRSAGALPAGVDGPPEDEVRWRGLRATQLQAAGAAAAVPPAPPVAEPVARARYVAFFASESHQVTPELRLPRGSRSARPQGLLTWAVAQALERRPATWRELFDGVLAAYPPVIDELAQRFPTRELPSPVAEGSLDLPLFSNRMESVSTRPAWRAQRAGATLTLGAGQLDGLVPQQTLRVLAALEDGNVRHAEAVLAQVDLDTARLTLPEALRELPGSTLWSATPVSEPEALALRVRVEGGLPLGAALEYPASIALDAEAGSDVRVVELGSGAWRLDLQSPALGGPAPGAVAKDPAAMRRQLEALARLKWFARLHELARGGRFDGLEVQLEAWRGDQLLRSGRAEMALESSVLPLRAGERATLHVRNTSGQSVNLVAVGIDGQGVLRAVYPQDPGESNRFERGTREAPAAKRFDLPWLAIPGSRLLVVAAPAAAYSAPRLFGAGLAEPLPDVRVRGQLAPVGARPTYAALIQVGRSGH